MRRTAVVVAFLTLAGVIADRAHAQTPARAASNYAPLSEYMMPREAEIALARSAAQPNISGRATIKALTASGFQVVREGDNGFVCLVMRGWAAPTFTPAAQRDSCLRRHAPRADLLRPASHAHGAAVLRAETQARDGRQDARSDRRTGSRRLYVRGQLPRRDTVSFGYMWSADQQLGPGVGHWHPHMMVFAPYYDNAMLGGNEVGVVPVVNDDAGTPFTVIVIPVDGKLAIKAQQR